MVQQRFFFHTVSTCLLFCCAWPMTARAAQTPTDVTHVSIDLNGPVQHVLIEQAFQTSHAEDTQESQRQKIAAISFDKETRLTQHIQYAADGTVNRKITYTYAPSTNTTQQIIYARHRVPQERITIIAEQDEQRHIRTFYTDGILLRQLITTRDAQGRIVKEEQYNTAGTLFHRLIHTFDEQGRKVATAHYNATGFFDGPIGTSEYVYTDVGQLRESRDYGPDGFLVRKWGYQDELDDHNNWTKRTLSRWVEKFGRSYFEPVKVLYRAITYYPGQGKQTAQQSPLDSTSQADAATPDSSS